jgi:hypothetical protein
MTTTPTSEHDPAEAVHGVAVPEGWELPDEPDTAASQSPLDGAGVADEQHADANPIERPEGAPYCWPFTKLPRRQRARFMDALAPALDAEDELEEMSYPAEHEHAGEPLPGKHGTYLALVTKLAADVEDAMVLVSPDEKVMRSWARKASDDDLLALMRWYVGRFQVGEA